MFRRNFHKLLGNEVTPESKCKPEDESLIRRYLLGELMEGERQEVEERLMTDDDFFDRTLLAEDDLIDQYARDELSGRDRKLFEQTILSTPDGRERVMLADNLVRHASKKSEAGNPVSRRIAALPLRAAVAAAILLAAGLGIWRVFFYQSDIDKGLLALNDAYRGQRPVEARISGFDYAPWEGVRGDQESVDHVHLNRAERILLDAVFEHPGSASHHAVGKLYLTERKFDEAVARFEASLKTDSNNARLYNDYGAALLESGRADRLKDEPGKRLAALARSLEHLNRAIQLDNSLFESLFNRALLYESMSLLQQAEDDWKEYLERDPDSIWAQEAQRHIDDLEERKGAKSQNKSELLAEFLEACQSRDDEKAYDLMSRNTEAITGQLVWWQLLEAYLNLAMKREGDEAGKYLKALSYAGELQKHRTGDRFVSDLARFYRSSIPPHQTFLVQAHALINEAHALLARSETDKAAELYGKARAIFDRAGDQPESWFASYWIGYSLYRKSEFERSLSVLSQVAEYGRLRGHLWLLECALTMIANIHGESNRFSTSLAFYKESLEISKKINDEYNSQKNLTSLAFAYKNLGDHKESLAYMHRCLERTNIYWPGARQMYRNFSTAAGILNTFGYYYAAAEYERAALQFAVETKDPGFEHLSYMQLGAIYSKLQNYNEALRCADQSYQIALAATNERTGLRPIALSSLQLAHIYRQTQDYDKAAAHYDDAIRLCGAINLFAYLYEAHKGRLLCYIAEGNDSFAEKEMQTVLAFFEEHRSKIREEKNRNSFFDLEQYIYDIAVDFEYSRRGDYQKAFEYSEMSRARSLLDLMNTGVEVVGKDSLDARIASVSQPLMLGNIRERMPAKTQILQYCVLDDKVLIWVVSKAKFEVAEKKIALSSLTQKALDYWQSLSSLSEPEAEESRRKGIELYDLLIRPVETLLEKDTPICIVPDKALNYLPFNALVSSGTGRYMIQDYVLSFAPSANTFLLCSEEARRKLEAGSERILSVGDPRFNRDAFPRLSNLPSSGREAEEVSRCYNSKRCLVGENARKSIIRSEMRKADVVHLASHYVTDEYNPMLSRLLLTDETRDAKGPSSEAALYGYDIYQEKLPLTRLVVLSACSTGIEQYYKGEGMVGMSRTFLFAGVPLVVASLWPVASDQTADLMISFHKYRKHSGLSSAEALRQAQIDMIDNPQRQYNRPYYWAAFILIGGQADF